MLAEGKLPPDVPPDFGYVTDAAQKQAQDRLAKLVPNAKHIANTNSGHEIQKEQPKLPLSSRKTSMLSRAAALRADLEHGEEMFAVKLHERTVGRQALCARVHRDWQNSFVSAYASMHTWEDFAETFAHYLVRYAPDVLRPRLERLRYSSSLSLFRGTLMKKPDSWCPGPTVGSRLRGALLNFAVLAVWRCRPRCQSSGGYPKSAAGIGNLADTKLHSSTSNFS